MTKYGNSDSENFSTSKYFIQPKSNTTIRKQLSVPVAEPIKYTNPVHQHQTLKPVSRYKKISHVENQQQKYFVADNTIIQKRDTRIQKGFWDKIISTVRGASNNNAARESYESWLEQQGKKTPSVESGASHYTGQSVSPEVLNAINQSRFAIPARGSEPEVSSIISERRVRAETPPGVLATQRDIMFDRMRLTTRQRNRIDEFETAMEMDAGPQSKTIYPYQSTDVLRAANPHAFQALMIERARTGRTPTVALSEREATLLSNRYGHADFVGEPLKPTIKTSDDFEDAWTSGGMLSPEELAIQPHRGSVTAREADDMPSLVTPEEKQFFDTYMDLGAEHPNTRKAYLNSLGMSDRENLRTIKDELSNEFSRDDRYQNAITNILERQNKYDEYIGRSQKPSVSSKSSVPALTEKPVVTEMPETKVPKVKLSESPAGLHDIDADPDYSLTAPKPVASGSSPSDYGFKTPIKSQNELNAERMQSLNSFFDEFNPTTTNTSVSSMNAPKKTKKPFQMPKMSLRQKMILGDVGLGSALAAGYYYMQPKTEIPDIVEPSGKKVRYGSTIEINPSAAIRTQPKTPSNDFWRPLKSGIAGSGGAPVYDDKGNQVYVRSPFPFAPNESPYDKNGKLKGLTTRGKEEMWRFGSDLYETDEKGNRVNWWSGKYTSVPKEYK